MFMISRSFRLKNIRTRFDMSSDAGSPPPDSQASSKVKVAFRFCREWYCLFELRSEHAALADTHTAATCFIHTKYLLRTDASTAAEIIQDVVNNVLTYRCRTCHNVEPTNNYCVFRNELATNAGETAGVTTDVGSDPTVKFADPTTRSVLKVFSFQSRISSAHPVGSWSACSFRVSSGQKIHAWYDSCGRLDGSSC